MNEKEYMFKTYAWDSRYKNRDLKKNFFSYETFARTFLDDNLWSEAYVMKFWSMTDVHEHKAYGTMAGHW